MARGVLAQRQDGGVGQAVGRGPVAELTAVEAAHAVIRGHPDAAVAILVEAVDDG